MDGSKTFILVSVVLVLILAAVVAYQTLRHPASDTPEESLVDTPCTIDDISVGELSAVARLLLSLNGKGRFETIRGSAKLSRDFGLLSDKLAVLLGYTRIDEVPDEELQVVQFCDTLAADIGFKLLLLQHSETLEDAFNGYRLQADPVLLDVSMPFMPSVATIQIVYTVASKQATATDRLAKASIPGRDLTAMAEWIFGCGGYGYATFRRDPVPITCEETYDDLIFGMANILGYGHTASLPGDIASYRVHVDELSYQYSQEFLDLLIEFGAFLTVLKLAFDEHIAGDLLQTIAPFTPDDTIFYQLRELHADYMLVKG